MSDVYLFIYQHWIEIILVWFFVSLIVSCAFGSFARKKWGEE